MKILFCHNYYRFRGGEDLSFESEVEMLRSHGDDVITYVRRNTQIVDSLSGKLRATGNTLYSRSARRDISELVRRHRPDVLHCNNLFPQISHSIYEPAREMGVPIVQALRNYRPFCANSFFYRDQRVCTDCLTKKVSFAAVRHACYRDSRAASGVVSTMQLLNRSIQRLRPVVDLYFTPSEFARQVYITGGYDGESIRVKRNFIYPDPGVGDGEENTMVFVGRLSQEKGIATLLSAWREEGLNVPLEIIGDGPMREEVEQFAATHPNVRYVGEVDLPGVLATLGKARCLVMPSLWYETFGRTIAEAFSRGTPVIASRLGAMAELVQDGHNGLLFTPGDAAELARAVRAVYDRDTVAYRSMRESARQAYLDRYTRETNYQALSEIYALALRRNDGRKPSARKTPESPSTSRQVDPPLKPLR